jgi:hypothetical protein
MEINGNSSTRATWDGRGPVGFPPKQEVKLLAPIQRMRFKDFEELGAALRSIGYLVTDLRKAVARIDDPYVAMALLADRTVEKFNEEIIIIRRFPDGTHDDGIWQLDPETFRFIRRSKLVHRSKTLRFGNFGREIFEWGPRTFDTLSDYHQSVLGYHMVGLRKRREKPIQTAVDVAPLPPVVDAPLPTPTVEVVVPSRLPARIESNVVSFQRPAPKSKPTPVPPAPLKVGDPMGTSFVVAHDDLGNPITMAEVTLEYVRAAPQPMPTIAVQFPKNCPDHEVRKLRMIERIRYRRRMQAKLAGA